MLLTVSSFLIVTALVAYISWLRTKNDDLTTSKGYFLAGRGLSGIVIGCSMVLTSLSTEQLIGVNANSYQNNFKASLVMVFPNRSVRFVCNVPKLRQNNL